MLKKETIKELQNILQEEYGAKVQTKKVEVLAEMLVSFFDSIKNIEDITINPKNK